MARTTKILKRLEWALQKRLCQFFVLAWGGSDIAKYESTETVPKIRETLPKPMLLEWITLKMK